MSYYDEWWFVLWEDFGLLLVLTEKFFHLAFELAEVFQKIVQIG